MPQVYQSQNPMVQMVGRIGVKMIGKCSSCKHWEMFYDDRPGFGACRNNKFKWEVDTYDKPLQGDELIYWDDEGLRAGFYTGQDFGCIHFEEADICP